MEGSTSSGVEETTTTTNPQVLSVEELVDGIESTITSSSTKQRKINFEQLTTQKGGHIPYLSLLHSFL
jgi:hypothetical protein